MWAEDRGAESLERKILKLLERADMDNSRVVEGKGRIGSQGLEEVKASDGKKEVKSWGSC